MNNFWSKKIQSTELLYYSRQERFNDENKDLWFKLLKIKNGTKILEVGCGGGHFTNMIKKYYPNCDVYGIDLDYNHIEFAKKECEEQGLNVNYQVADIKNIPFDDESFDIVFSHTVIEHLPFDDFIKEQKRVLKENGNLIIMRVDMIKKNDMPFDYLENEIGAVYDKMDIPKSQTVCNYIESPNLTMQRLAQYNFKNINLDYNRIIYYMPDVANDKNISLKQIEKNYLCKVYNALFNLDKAVNGKDLKDELLSLLKRQYEERLKIFNSGKRLFDFQSSLLITISAQK